MKKFLICFTITLFSVLASKAQGTFKLGLNLPLPIQEAREVSKFSFGVDTFYMYEITETFDVGMNASYLFAFPTPAINRTSVGAIQFVPLAIATSFLASKDFSVDVDLGYAVGINEGNKGGLYYKPKLNYFLTDKINLNIFYMGINGAPENNNWTNIGAGATIIIK